MAKTNFNNYGTRGIDNPCFKCVDRQLGCHSTCEKYKEFADEGDAIKKARYDYVMHNRISYKYKQATINRLRGKKR